MGQKIDDLCRKAELFSLVSSQSADFFGFTAIEERQRQIWYGKFHSKIIVMIKNPSSVKGSAGDIHTGNQNGARGSSENGIHRCVTMPGGWARGLEMQIVESKFPCFGC